MMIELNDGQMMLCLYRETVRLEKEGGAVLWMPALGKLREYCGS